MATCSETKTPIVVREVTTPLGVCTLKACDKGVHHLALTKIDENFDPNVSAGNVKEIPKKALEAEEGSTPMNKAVNWLVSYFENPSNLSGKIPSVCFPTDSSTEFERKVWTALGEKVGFGKTVTYSQLAGTAIDNPKASRAVGTAMKKNPIPLMIPCHRVIRADGEIGNYSMGGSTIKKWLLEHENTGA